MNNKLYSKVEKLAKGIREDLRKQGFVIPTENGDGTITVDNYTIIKQRTGFYTIRNRSDDVIVDKINLPQTAALLANGLALGKLVDDNLLTTDRQYGYSLFEELLAKRSIEKNARNKNYERLDLMCIKMTDAAERKDRAKKAILNSFEKLRRLR
jgi:hypothetical protein